MTEFHVVGTSRAEQVQSARADLYQIAGLMLAVRRQVVALGLGEQECDEAMGPLRRLAERLVVEQAMSKEGT